MTTSYVRYTPDQELLLPPSLREWLPEGHLAYFISDTIHALDLSVFHERYASGGTQRQDQVHDGFSSTQFAWLRESQCRVEVGVPVVESQTDGVSVRCQCLKATQSID